MSFCLNYSAGGNIPQDNTGSYKWTPSVNSWYNVDYFQTYLLASKNATEKGISATQIYSSNSFPPSSYTRQMKPGDVIQFSSAGQDDWTHSAIITEVTIAGDVSICSHDAEDWDEEVKLQTFYNGEYAGTAQLIKLVRINGYYN